MTYLCRALSYAFANSMILIYLLVKHHPRWCALLSICLSNTYLINKQHDRQTTKPIVENSNGSLHPGGKAWAAGACSPSFMWEHLLERPQASPFPPPIPKQHTLNLRPQSSLFTDCVSQQSDFFLGLEAPRTPQQHYWTYLTTRIPASPQAPHTTNAPHPPLPHQKTPSSSDSMSHWPAVYPFRHQPAELVIPATVHGALLHQPQVKDVGCMTFYALVAQSGPALYDPMDCSPPGSSDHGDSPGKNTGGGCHALFQGIFPRPNWAVRQARRTTEESMQVFRPS